LIHDPALIFQSLYSTGELGVWIKEQSLILHTDKGIILITGCAHPGIINIVKTAKKLIGDSVLLVIGGFHFSGASKIKVDELIYKLNKLGVRYVGPCHCSGVLLRQTLITEHCNKYIEASLGRVIKVASL
jgi:7,8-dihydropterin-6-yl-methyl-4-(beta-D-ribofuranosyl)aminobenzene 5'-phosphate synthase